VPHTFFAETEGAKVLVGLAPVTFEGFIREAGTPAPERVLPPRPDGPPDMTRPQARARHDADRRPRPSPTGGVGLGWKPRAAEL
jgi:hypothetical protein